MACGNRCLPAVGGPRAWYQQRARGAALIGRFLPLIRRALEGLRRCQVSCLVGRAAGRAGGQEDYDYPGGQ